MAVEKKKEEEIQRESYASVSPIQPTSTPQTTPQAQPAVRSVYDSLMAKRNEASAKEDVAKKNWRKAYEETGNVMAGFVPKPKDNTYEEKRLRRAAIAQALGELVGTIGQGIVATGRGGEGYVTAPLGMYNNTMQQLQKLKDQGIADEKEYANLMANLRMQNANRDLAMRQKEYEEAATERQAYDKMLLGYDQKKMALDADAEERKHRAEEAEKNRKHEAEEAEKDRKNRITAAQISANKSGRDDEAKDLSQRELEMYVALSPTGKKTTRVEDENGNVTTTRPYESKAERSLRERQAKELATLGVSPAEIKRMKELLDDNNAVRIGAPMDMTQVILLLKAGKSLSFIENSLNFKPNNNGKK